MNKDKFFYSIWRYNGSLDSKREFYPMLDRVLYGDEAQAKRLLAYVESHVTYSDMDSRYKIFLVNFMEI